MNIRRMAKEDLQFASQLDQMSFHQPWPTAAFEFELANPGARCWVVEIDEVVVALLVIWGVLDEAHIATIAVHPDFRQQGIGKALIKTGMDAAYQEGARIYHLEVRAGNLAAQKLYEGLGFAVVGRRPRYYQDNGEDALLLTLVRE